MSETSPHAPWRKYADRALNCTHVSQHHQVLVACPACISEALANLAADHQGFDELMARLYNDRPILPCPDYSQDVAFLATCFDKWRKEANQRGKELNDLQSELAEAKSEASGLQALDKETARAYNANLLELGDMRQGLAEAQAAIRAAKNLLRQRITDVVTLHEFNAWESEHAPAIRAAEGK